MYTIYNYLDYYKNTKIKEYKWNELDNLLCAILVYSPVRNFKKLSLNEFADRNLSYDHKSKDLMVPKVKEILQIIRKSERYKDMVFYNFINRLDQNTQFGAVTIKINNIKVISFKGSDGSLIGWLENFRIIYQYPTYTQKLAIDYLKKSINFFDKNVYVVGHSKGGNLALISSIELNNYKLNKVKKIYNFDGPGVRKDNLNSLKRISGKLENIIPTGSYIGVLLFNNNYKVITTSSHAINEHYPTSWNCFGGQFVQGKLSKASNKLHINTTDGLKKLENDKIEKVFEESFKLLDRSNVTRIDFNFSKLMEIVKVLRGLDSKYIKYIYKILGTMFSLSRK